MHEPTIWPLFLIAYLGGMLIYWYILDEDEAEKLVVWPLVLVKCLIKLFARAIYRVVFTGWND